MTNNSWWFYLEPYIHTTIKSGKMLLYNTLDATFIETSESKLIELVKDTFSENNLGVTKLSGKELEASPYKTFISEVRDKYMGDIIKADSIEGKPFQLYPKLNLQKDIERPQNQRADATGLNVLSYLSELTIFINSTCKQSCKNCSWFARQTKCCSQHLLSNEKEEIPVTTIDQLVKKFSGIKITLSGGNILLHSQWNKLSDIISQNPVTIYLNYLNLAEATALPTRANVCIPVTFPIQADAFKKALDKTKKLSVEFHFLITNENELEEAEHTILEHGLEKHKIIPIYDGGNEKFFRYNIFLDKEDIFETPLA